MFHNIRSLKTPVNSRFCIIGGELVENRKRVGIKTNMEHMNCVYEFLFYSSPI